MSQEQINEAAHAASKAVNVVSVAAGAASGGVGTAVTAAARKMIGDKLLNEAVETAFKYKNYWWLLFIPPLLSLGLFFFFMVSFVSLFVPSEEQGFNGGSPSIYADAQIPPDQLQIFISAQKKYGVAWNVLAAIAKVESDFNRNPEVSKKGAVGYMQFMPTTWSGNSDPIARDDPNSPSYDTDPKRIAKYGGYGEDANGDSIADPYEPWDAVFAAAHLLSANGFHDDPRKALYAYNHGWWYVDEILEIASTYTSGMLPDGVAKCLPVPTNLFIVSSHFGNRYDPFIPSKTVFHQGIDIGAPQGTQVIAVDVGTVVSSGYNDGFGLEIVIDHGSYKTQYAHLDRSFVRPKDTVVPGDVIGAMGNSGRSTGPHLHFGVYVNGIWCDPEAYLGSLEGDTYKNN